MKLRIVIWNLKGLSLISDSTRLDRARDAFRTLSNDHETAAFALVELGDEQILEDLANQLGDGWTSHYGSVGKVQGSIGVLINRNWLSAVTQALKSGPYYDTGKPINRQTASVFQVHYDKNPRFLLAVVHFKAERGGSEYHTRLLQAQWLRTELERIYSEINLPIVIVGDFNGEPYESMFGEGGFRAHRRADAMLRSQDSLKFYNPMWRLLPDPPTVRVRQTSNQNQTSTPYGTFLDTIWHSLIDGVIVSSEWLEDEKHVLHDDRLEILTDAQWYHRGSQGAQHARPAGITKDLAITDHLPIAVHLEIK